MDDGSTFEERLQEARRVLGRAPLVHATMDAPFAMVLRAGVLEPRVPRANSGDVAEHLGPAVYFFWAAAAYPSQKAAILIDVSAVGSTGTTTVTPFDTGACDRGFYRLAADDSPPNHAWVHAHMRTVDAANGVCDWGCEHVATHFKRANVGDYVRRAQISVPDEPLAHGIVDTSGDRRAWTMEVQARGAVAVGPETVRHLVTTSRATYLNVPDELRSRTAFVFADEGRSDLESAVVAYILEEST